MGRRTDRVSPLGRHLQRSREAAKLTRGDVAERLGITEQAVGAWERGDRTPDYSHLERLRRIYAMTEADVTKALRLAQGKRPAKDRAA